MHPRTGGPLKSRGVGEGSICLCEPSPFLRSYLRSPKFGLRNDPAHQPKCVPAKPSIGSTRCIVLFGLEAALRRRSGMSLSSTPEEAIRKTQVLFCLQVAGLPCGHSAIESGRRENKGARAAPSPKRPFRAAMPGSSSTANCRHSSDTYERSPGERRSNSQTRFF